MNTVLVTGGCGFIGSHFIGLILARTDRRVVNLDALTYAGNLDNLSEIEEGSRYRFVKGDITDAEEVDRLFHDEKPKAVVNFAAESHVDRSILDSFPFLKTNILGLQVLLDAARRHGVPRFVQISTDEVYGDIEGKEASEEESPLLPSSPYASSKASADLLCMAYHRTYDFPVVITRSSNNYGPFQFPEKLIPLLIRNALNGKELPIYGPRAQGIDLPPARRASRSPSPARAGLACEQQLDPDPVAPVGIIGERVRFEPRLRTLIRFLNKHLFLLHRG